MSGASNSAKTGHVVWHELHTPDVEGAVEFYGTVAGWRFVEEHAQSFAWGDGPGSYVLALVGDEAGAGLVARPEIQTAYWLAYIEVDDTDAASARLLPQCFRLGSVR